MGSAAGEAVRAGGGGDRYAGGEPNAGGDRGFDRVLRQHGGAADRPEGMAESGRAAGASEGGGGGGAAESGSAVRAGGGAGAAGEESVALADLSGDVRLAECAGG